MTITFYLRFHTEVGQELLISGNLDLLGSRELYAARRMTWLDNESWFYTLELPEKFDDIISYNYLLKDKDGTIVFDGEDDRVLDISTIKTNSLSVIDTWNADSDVNNVYFTSPFSKVLLTPVPKVKSSSPKKYTHEFRVKAPLLADGEIICLLGSSNNLKYWDTNEPVLMEASNNWFVARVAMETEGFPFTYKYGIYNTIEKKFIRFEEDANRILRPGRQQSITILHDGFVRCTPSRVWKGTGVAIPVFSLRSEKSFGVGEFNDMLLLIDWAKKTGLKLIQILPVNDTTATYKWMDSYPYAAISAFALHPIYIHLEKVAGKKHGGIVKALKKKKKQLNELAAYDYEQVMKFKMGALREIFAESKNQFKDDPAYFEFFELNREWLVPYAVFSYLRDEYKTADFTKWKKLKKFGESAVQKFASPRRKHYAEIAFYYFIQYHLHLQLREVKEYAHRNEVILKGDIAIGIYRNGSDAWSDPSLYNLEEQAGAPPDDFAVKGQNWGFPTYNWDVMSRTGILHVNPEMKLLPF